MNQAVQNKILKEITISSKTENVSKIEKFVDELSEQYNLGTEKYGNILVAVIEGTNNAIIHGNKLDENKPVSISCLRNEKGLVFSIKDQGSGFNYSNIPDPTAEENIENPHGRGIFLMRNLADKVSYNESGNVVELFFSL